MVQEQSFSGTDWANPYLHLRAFEYMCSCLTIAGMTQETLKWKLFPFSLISFARRWYDQHVASMEGSWERLRAAFCLDFFPLSRTISLRREIFCFEQSEGETIGAAWSRFKILLWSGPDMTIPDEVIIQHFFAGLSSAAGQYLNLACGGSFVHCTAIKCREILDRIQEQFSFNDIHEPVPLTTSVEHASPSTVDEDPVPVPSEDDASSSGSPFHFEDEIFDDYGNTSLYFCEKKPPTLSHLADPIGKADRLDATRKLTHILCDDWLRESELSPQTLLTFSPLSYLSCIINGTSINVPYDPVVGANIVSSFFLYAHVGYTPLTPTTKYLKSPSEGIIDCLGIARDIVFHINEVDVLLSFYVFETYSLDVVIGVPIEKLVLEIPLTGNINVKLGKDILSVPVARSCNALVEPSPDDHPTQDILSVSPFEQSEESPEFFAQHSTDHENELETPLELSVLEPPSRPPIELKILPAGLRYAVLGGDKEFPVIISDKLYGEES